MRNGAAIHAKDNIGFTPLHRAAASGKLQVVRIMVDEASVNLNIEDHYKMTPIAVAAEANNETVVLFLAARGANLYVVLTNEQTDMYDLGAIR